MSEDDPSIQQFHELNQQGVINLKVWPDVGLEIFAQQIYFVIWDLITEEKNDQLILKTVEVREHQGASSLYIE